MCLHESKLHARNCFVTLTYDEANLPRLSDGRPTLYPRDVVLFLKRLRKEYGDGIRFFQCGEYGEKGSRPHHHMLLFNFEFDDRVRYGNSETGALYVSRKLDRLWSKGLCTVGDVTFESANYVARYVVKKQFDRKSWVPGVSPFPEYLTMSRRPGIGFGWFLKHYGEWYRDDSCVVNGVRSKPTRFYDDKMAELHPDKMRRIRGRRRVKANSDVDNSGKRLVAREAVKLSQVSTLARKV